MRALQQYAYQRPVVRPYRVFVIRTDNVTHEAQNALLKLFEDPPLTSAFVLSIDRDDRILPTLRSRFEVVRLLHTRIEHRVASDFLALSYAQRFEEIARRHKAKDMAWCGELISSLEEIFHASMHTAVLRDLAVVSRHFLARGSSVKMLLEHLSLALPIQR